MTPPCRAANREEGRALGNTFLFALGRRGSLIPVILAPGSVTEKCIDGNPDNITI